MKKIKLLAIALVSLLLLACGGGGGSTTAQSTGANSNAVPKATINSGGSYWPTGSQVSIQGFGVDENGDQLTYKWYLRGKPSGSNLRLGEVGQGSILNITPDISGEYILSLIVSDGKAESVEAFQTVVANSLPKLDFGRVFPVNRDILLGQTVELDANNTIDLDGDQVVVQWQLVEKPPLSALNDFSLTRPFLTFTPDVVGRYKVELSVDDGKQKYIWGEKFSINVQGTDREGPTWALVSTNLPTNGRVDLSSSPFDLVVKVAVNDATGVSSSVFEYIDSYTGNFVKYLPFAKLWGAPDLISAFSVQRVLGDFKKGVYEIKVRLPMNSQKGRWAFSAGFIYDLLGNSGGEIFFEFYVD